MSRKKKEKNYKKEKSAPTSCSGNVLQKIVEITDNYCCVSIQNNQIIIIIMVITITITIILITIIIMIVIIILW